MKRDIKKLLILGVVLVLFALCFAVASFGEENEYERVTELRNEGVFAFKSSENISEDVVVAYDLGAFISVMESKNGRASVYEIVKNAEDNDFKRYLLSKNNSYVLDSLYNDYLNSKGTVKIFDTEHTLLDTILFSTDDGLTVKIYFTETDIWVDLGSYGKYTWEDFCVIYESYKNYEKPLDSWRAYFLAYFKDVFPFTNFEDDTDKGVGKDVLIATAADISSLRNDNITSLKNHFSDSDYSLNSKNIVLTYGGLFETDTDIYDMIKNAEKNANIKYIAYSSSFDAFKVNSAYKVSDKIFDKNYLYPVIDHFENYPDHFDHEDNRYTVEEKVYFWDVEYGFVAFFVTDSGVFGSVYNPYNEVEFIFPIQELSELKRCYDRYTDVNKVYHGSFCTYLTELHPSLTSSHHDRMDEIALDPDREGTFLRVSNGTKMNYGFDGNDTFISVKFCGTFSNMFAQNAGINDILCSNVWQRYYVIEEGSDEITCITVNDKGEVIKVLLNDTKKSNFLKIYEYALDPLMLFDSSVKINGVYFLEEQYQSPLIVYFATSEGDYVLYSPSLVYEERLYFMPASELCLCAQENDTHYLSMDSVGEGGWSYVYHRDCSNYIINLSTEDPSITTTPDPTEPDQAKPTPTVLPVQTPDNTDNSKNNTVLIIVSCTLAVVLVAVVLCIVKRKKTS